MCRSLLQDGIVADRDPSGREVLGTESGEGGDGAG